LCARLVDDSLIELCHAVQYVCEYGHDGAEFRLGEGCGGEARVFVLCEECWAEGYWVQQAEFCKAGEVVAEAHCAWALEE
jgi:hypothetical protein